MRAGASGKEHGDDMVIAIFPEVHYGIHSLLHWLPLVPKGQFLNACLSCQGKNVLTPQHVEM